LENAITYDQKLSTPTIAKYFINGVQVAIDLESLFSGKLSDVRIPVEEHVVEPAVEQLTSAQLTELYNIILSHMTVALPAQAAQEEQTLEEEKEEVIFPEPKSRTEYAFIRSTLKFDVVNPEKSLYGISTPEEDEERVKEKTDDELMMLEQLVSGIETQLKSRELEPKFGIQVKHEIDGIANLAKEEIKKNKLYSYYVLANQLRIRIDELKDVGEDETINVANELGVIEEQLTRIQEREEARVFGLVTQSDDEKTITEKIEKEQERIRLIFQETVEDLREIRNTLTDDEVYSIDASIDFVHNIDIALLGQYGNAAREYAEKPKKKKITAEGLIAEKKMKSTLIIYKYLLDKQRPKKLIQDEPSLPQIVSSIQRYRAMIKGDEDNKFNPLVRAVGEIDGFAANFIDQLIEIEDFEKDPDAIKETPAEARDSVVLVVNNYTPKKLDDMLKKYDIAAIITDQASPIAHWISKATNLGIIVIYNVVDEDGDPLHERVDEEDSILITLGKDKNAEPLVRVVANPSDESSSIHKEAKEQFLKIIKFFESVKRESIFTQDGGTLNLKFNVDKIEAIGESVEEEGGTGIGLMRTEYLYQKEKSPSESYLINTFLDFSRKTNGFVTIRLIDYQKDKLMGRERYWGEEYGFSFYRTEIGREVVFSQIKALMKSHMFSERKNIQLLVPSIKTDSDVTYIMELIERARNELEEEADILLPQLDTFRVGLMVEYESMTQSSELELLLNNAHFISIGTNDLMSDMFNLDRERDSEKLSDYFENLRPELLMTITRILAKAKSMDREVTICGELGGSHLFILYLLSLGLNNVSVSFSPMYALNIALFVHAITDDDIRAAKKIFQQMSGFMSITQPLRLRMKILRGHTDEQSTNERKATQTQLKKFDEVIRDRNDALRKIVERIEKRGFDIARGTYKAKKKIEKPDELSEKQLPDQESDEGGGGRMAWLTKILEKWFGLSGNKLLITQVVLEQIPWAVLQVGSVFAGFSPAFIGVVFLGGAFFFILHYVFPQKGRAPPNRADILKVAVVNIFSTLVVAFAATYLFPLINNALGPQILYPLLSIDISSYFHYALNKERILPKGRSGRGVIEVIEQPTQKSEPVSIRRRSFLKISGLSIAAFAASNAIPWFISSAKAKKTKARDKYDKMYVEDLKIVHIIYRVLYDAWY